MEFDHLLLTMVDLLKELSQVQGGIVKSSRLETWKSQANLIFTSTGKSSHAYNKAEDTYTEPINRLSAQ